MLGGYRAVPPLALRYAVALPEGDDEPGRLVRTLLAAVEALLQAAASLTRVTDEEAVVGAQVHALHVCGDGPLAVSGAGEGGCRWAGRRRLVAPGDAALGPPRGDPERLQRAPRLVGGGVEAQRRRPDTAPRGDGGQVEADDRARVRAGLRVHLQDRVVPEGAGRSALEQPAVGGRPDRDRRRAAAPDRPRVLRGRRVDVRGLVDRADAEAVTAGSEPRVLRRRRADRERGAVERALEGRAQLVRVEREARARARGACGRRVGDRRLGRRRVLRRRRRRRRARHAAGVVDVAARIDLAELGLAGTQ